MGPSRPNVLEVVLKPVSGVAQVHIVKCVQEVGAELHVRRFGEVEVLHQPDIGVKVSRAIHGSLRRAVSKVTWCRIRVARRAHPLKAAKICGWLAASKFLLNAAVRTSSTRAGSCRSRRYHKWPAGSRYAWTRWWMPASHRPPGWPPSSCWRRTACPFRPAVRRSHRRRRCCWSCSSNWRNRRQGYTGFDSTATRLMTGGHPHVP